MLNEQSYRAAAARPRRGKLFRLLWPITSYIVTNLTVALFWVYFFVLNKTTVIGRSHVGDHRNTLLLSNHQSMIDSFLVGLAAYFPKSLVKPHLMPWNPAAVENFYRTPILGWLADNWKCIPVRPGRRDMRVLRRMTELLPHSVMTLFPEGTRTRDGSVGDGRPGAGLIALATNARVIPVAIHGMHEVLPIGRVLPRMFKRIYVCYGPVVEYADLLDRGRGKETAQQLVDRAVEAIRGQHAELTRIAATA
jgi:1-acyl-sn-glycerol-3-phosphate acyltransferase